jgi:AraC-like DNA-binding protein
MDQVGSSRLYSWRARSLFIGQPFGLTPHRNAVDVLAIGLDRSFAASQGINPGYRIVRSLHIPANTLHHLRDIEGRMAFLYVDPLDVDREVIATLETEIRQVIERLAGDGNWQAARRDLDALMSSSSASDVDPRIAAAVKRLRDNPGDRPSLAEVARGAGLSASRFRHLFVAATGVPYRRFLIWTGMGEAMRAARAGVDLTTAAHQGGFSSSAHFSSTFRQMFGLAPSELLASLGGQRFPVIRKVLPEARALCADDVRSQ